MYIDYKDREGLLRQAEEGARWGFTGKQVLGGCVTVLSSCSQVIHPGQVSVVQEAFSPSQSRVEWATALLEEHARHQEGGRGAFSFRGAMIDMPTVKQAENVLKIQQKRP